MSEQFRNPNEKIVKRGQIDTPNINIYELLLSFHDWYSQFNNKDYIMHQTVLYGKINKSLRNSTHTTRRATKGSNSTNINKTDNHFLVVGVLSVPRFKASDYDIYVFVCYV
jgi:hypothetical protein